MDVLVMIFNLLFLLSGRLHTTDLKKWDNNVWDYFKQKLSSFDVGMMVHVACIAGKKITRIIVSIIQQFLKATFLKVLQIDP